MAFFGLEQNDVFEREKQQFRAGGGGGSGANGASGAMPEFTWGEESYDGLGNALLEGGDDLNDETFGGSGPVGEWPVEEKTSSAAEVDGKLAAQARILILALRRCRWRECPRDKDCSIRLGSRSPRVSR